jgi:hypothetical protein
MTARIRLRGRRGLAGLAGARVVSGAGREGASRAGGAVRGGGASGGGASWGRVAGEDGGTGGRGCVVGVSCASWYAWGAGDGGIGGRAVVATSGFAMLAVAARVSELLGLLLHLFAYAHPLGSSGVRMGE